MPGTVLYVAVGGENKIAAYELESRTGSLLHLGDTPCPAPFQLASDPGNRFLYAVSMVRFRCAARTTSHRPIKLH